MQQNYDIRIFKKYGELLGRHLETNEELRLFFEKHPGKKKDYVLKMIDSGPIEDFSQRGQNKGVMHLFRFLPLTHAPL